MNAPGLHECSFARISIARAELSRRVKKVVVGYPPLSEMAPSSAAVR